MQQHPTLSLIIPVRDEEENIPLFHEQIRNVVRILPYTVEICYVENGSRDRSTEILEQFDDATTIFLANDRSINIPQKSAAMCAGIDHTEGEIIAMIDADLQNDPAELPLLLTKLEEGFDLVVGWRQKRRGPIMLRIVSRIGQICRYVCGFRNVHDPACGMKVFRRQAIENLTLYGESERYIPDLLSIDGWNVTEVIITHYKRHRGYSKYPWTKGLRAMADLIGLWFLRHYADRPLQFFGSIGIILTTVGIVFWGSLGILRAFQILYLSDRIWPLFATTILLIGLQLIVFGLLADILARLHFSSQKPYQVRKVIHPQSST